MCLSAGWRDLVELEELHDAHRDTLPVTNGWAEPKERGSEQTGTRV